MYDYTVQVCVLAASNLSESDRHIHPYARLTVGKKVVQTNPVWHTANPVWDFEETFREVMSATDLLVEVWGMPGNQLFSSKEELYQASQFLGCITVRCCYTGHGAG